MTVRTIQAHGKTFRFGRKRPTVVYPHLSLRNYMTTTLPPPPTSVDYSAGAANALAQMYGNDSLGDCVCACVAHSVGVFTGNAMNPTGGLVMTNAQVISVYEQACGYNPSNPQSDQGCNIQPTLAFWQKNGVPIGTTHQPAGILAVDPTNITEVQTAIWLFENVIFGVELPDAWVNPVPHSSGFIWDVAGAPDPNNGHCFPGVGYDTSDNITISTWAMTGKITPGAVAKYIPASAGGELWTVVSQDSINIGTLLAPSGFNWGQLQADFAALGGVTPVPPVPPVPPPPPGPTTGVGSTQWLLQNLGIANYRRLAMATMQPNRPSAVGTPAWLKANLPAQAWSALLSADNAA